MFQVKYNVQISDALYIQTTSITIYNIRIVHAIYRDVLQNILSACLHFAIYVVYLWDWILKYIWKVYCCVQSIVDETLFLSFWYTWWFKLESKFYRNFSIEPL